jgi:acyl-CoA synthetase (AMP-forming)/AMP-acid ligase II
MEEGMAAAGDGPAQSIDGVLEAAAAMSPARPFLLGPSTGLTYAQTFSALRHVATGIGAAATARPELRIAGLCMDGPLAVVGFLAAASVGVYAPLNPGLTEYEIRTSLDQIEADIVLTAGQTPATIDQALDRDGRSRLHLTAEMLSDDVLAAPDRSRRPDDVCLLLSTSGTTGKPKLVPLTHAQLLSSARSIAANLRLTSDDRVLSLMPFFHVHGLVAGLLAILVSQGSVYCHPATDLAHVASVLVEHRPTWFTAVPTIHRGILDVSRRWPAGWSHSLRFIRSCSAALPPRTHAELEAVFGVPVVEAYGMTEASHEISCNPLPPASRRVGSVGRPTGAAVRIVDDGDVPLPAGRVGHVLIRGPGITSGYVDDAVATARDFVDGWFRTGDQGSLDEEGYVYLAGRTKELINRGGEKIYPREVDEALTRHPAVQEAVAFAVSHPRLGEEVGAAVVLHPGNTVTIDELRDFLGSYLAPFKMPRQIAFLDELPKGPTGKLHRARLAELVAVTRLDAADPVAPRSSDETALAAIWRGVLGADEIGPADDFFTVGGDSILGLQLVQQVNASFGVDLAPADLFGRANTVEKMARLLRTGRAPAPARLVSAESDRAWLSPYERQQWLFQAVNPESGAANGLLAVAFRGRLDVDVLQRSLEAVITRHDLLRSLVCDDGDRPYFVVHPDPGIELQVTAIPGASVHPLDARIQDIAEVFADQAFDPNEDLPVRALLVTAGDQQHVLLLAINHLVSDAWSRSVIYRDLLITYEDLAGGPRHALPELTVPGTAAGRWLWDRLADNRDVQTRFWRSVFETLPPDLGLWRRTAGAGSGHSGRWLEEDVTDDVVAALRRRAARLGLTPFEVLLGESVRIVCRGRPTADIVVGVPVSLRHRAEFAEHVGYLVAMTPVRVKLDGSESPDQILERVSTSYRSATEHCHLPLDQIIALVDRRPGTDRPPMFDFVVKRDLAPAACPTLTTIHASRLEIRRRSAQFAVLVDLTSVLASTETGNRPAVVNVDGDRVDECLTRDLATLVRSAAAPDLFGIHRAAQENSG